MPQLDSLNYLNQLLGLALYIGIFYYVTLQFLLPHTLALFKLNEWVVNKIVTYIFHINNEKLICLTFLKVEWHAFITYIQKSLIDTKSIFNQLAITEQYMLLGSLYELIVEEHDASI